MVEAFRMHVCGVCTGDPATAQPAGVGLHKGGTGEPLPTGCATGCGCVRGQQARAGRLDVHHMRGRGGRRPPLSVSGLSSEAALYHMQLRSPPAARVARTAVAAGPCLLLSAAAGRAQHPRHGHGPSSAAAKAAVAGPRRLPTALLRACHVCSTLQLRFSTPHSLPMPRQDPSKLLPTPT